MSCRSILYAVVLIVQTSCSTALPHGSGGAISNDEVVTVRPSGPLNTRQKLPNFVGVSEATAGSKGLSMNLVIIPPGGKAEAHTHKEFESAVYLMKGRVQTFYGPGLKKSVINQQGDFLFIPPNVPHQPVNLSDTEEAVAVVSRNDPREQEHVMIYKAEKEGE